MGTCAVAIKKKSPLVPAGRSVVVDITLSASYATGGDTVTLASLGLKRISALVLASSGGGRLLEVVHGANEYTAPLIKAYQDNAVAAAAALGEVANATNLSAITVRAIAYVMPYR